MKELIRLIIDARLWTDTKGQDLVEYALLAGFITVAVGAGFPPVTSNISTIFSRIGSLLNAS